MTVKLWDTRRLVTYELKRDLVFCVTFRLLRKFLPCKLPVMLGRGNSNNADHPLYSLLSLYILVVNKINTVVGRDWI